MEIQKTETGADDRGPVGSGLNAGSKLVLVFFNVEIQRSETRPSGAQNMAE